MNILTLNDDDLIKICSLIFENDIKTFIKLSKVCKKINYIIKQYFSIELQSIENAINNIKNEEYDLLIFQTLPNIDLVKKINTDSILNFLIENYNHIFSHIKRIKLPTNLSVIDNISIQKPLKIKNVKYVNLFKTIEKVELLYGSFITDISNITECQNLKFINLFANYKLVDITPLSKCNNIEKISLFKCSKINDISCLKNCKKLKWINLMHCLNITQNQIDDLQEALPRCRITY
tara:strand:- start:2546 stop:3250 length:705 start_codon:yes stop_codon:yes gene_type:complete